MGKNKKSKKVVAKLAVGSTVRPISQLGVKTAVGNGSHGTPSTTKPVISITGVSKNGSATSIDGESGHEGVGTDLHIDIDSIDHSVTREPINLGVKNVRQIMTCIKEGTTEVKDVILNECNIIYECKICLNLFRSLANFIAHKRIYCKNHFCERMLLFDSTVLNFNHDNCQDHHVEDDDVHEDEQIDFVSPTSSSAENVNPDKDKPTVTRKRKFIDSCIKKVENDKQKEQDSNLLELNLSSIKTNPNAVFQTLQTNELNSDNETSEKSENVIKNKKEIISELFKDAKCCRESNKSEEPNKIQALKRQRVEEMLSRAETEGEINGKPTIEVQNVKCDICNSTFTSSKTYKVHIRTIHSSNRVIYPCPLCSLTFKQLSNATRHIIQIHKRTKTQANTLREVMKRRAYSTNSSDNSDELDEPSDDDDDDDDDDHHDHDDLHLPDSIDQTENSSYFTSRTVEDENSKSNDKHPPRINAPCVYNCGNVFDWAPAKRSHEKSCRKKFEQEKEVNSVSEVNGSSHSSELTSKNHKINSSNYQTEVENSSKSSSQESETVATVAAVPTVPIVPNHTSNPSTNINLPRRVEEKIKEFADLKSLRCTLCPSQDFMNLNQLLQHAVNHIGYSIYKCHGCSYHTIYENDMKFHLINSHNIGEDMISKHYQTLPSLTQPRLLIVPVKARKSINGPAVSESQNEEKNSKLKIHLRTMGNTSKKCYEIVDK